ncbi:MULTISPECIES: sigma 54-interacting transcriptional regulator [Bacillus]|uniref:Sigma-54-dependent Fis family transcriptional regulator n=1 Tax=Bacillus thuringiensis serovar sooncheon TaxID=180891 RepID=A0A9Q5X5A3_BACTU|nr:MULTISPECIES: sigma 54-interacting transcriptional regulator [Bacillus]OTW71843.1 sigma-54-dependent Fis family transcriptional regulator [Bacillus thuringiensis serovar coreanensis]OTX55463.1 sigma-54-dependent Fis family transcriptional regulator [Bacillus thuringiensis serovar sooncheon]OTX58800.1 sigma-54-dependent Fis family transcriptional regulator [Bacillus thuringiensis serovar guiyangiensis]OTX72568.1 sigma-54-dependent Fis family transcriptional regulator [Bacillus thuringiensis s
MHMNERMNLQVTSQALQVMNNGIAVISHGGIITYSNKLFCSMLHKKENEIIGEHISAIIPDRKKLVMNQNDSLYRYECRSGNQVLIVNESSVYQNETEYGSIVILESKGKSIQSLESIISRYESALNLLSECILGVNEQGIVNFLSGSYAQFLGIDDPKEAIGKHCTEVVENTRMHIIVKTGQMEIGHIQRISNRNIIATRIPIIKEGKIIGAIGKIMFHDIQQFKALGDQISEMESKLSYYQTELQRLQEGRLSFQSIIGESAKMKEVKMMALKVSKSRSTVLIRGESGTGKELFAHAVHRASPRASGTFIRLNCAAIPRELLEAELFGYEEGAFTGAKKGGKPGKIELADKGTLFLDEIGDMSLDMQVKLLRVLQEKEIERIGGTKIQKVDVRFIAATHRNLREMVQRGEFREDLYYRLNVFEIDIPPLRERKEDMIHITEFLIKKLNGELGSNVLSLDKRVRDIFMEHDWPGNIRELENVLERAMNVIEEMIIQVHHLPAYLRKKDLEEELYREIITMDQEQDEGSYSLQVEVESAEKRAITRALEKTARNIKEAADLLGIHRASLYRKIEKYEMS